MYHLTLFISRVSVTFYKFVEKHILLHILSPEIPVTKSPQTQGSLVSILGQRFGVYTSGIDSKSLYFGQRLGSLG